ncbi:hypothetical protein ROZALSC1DRAFT_26727, partial [Rozella allomycis CSF55]
WLGGYMIFLGSFQVSFHPIKGNTIDWINAHEILAKLIHGLNGIEYNVLPSGCHHIHNDIIISALNADNEDDEIDIYYSISLFKRRDVTRDPRTEIIYRSLGVIVTQSAPFGAIAKELESINIDIFSDESKGPHLASIFNHSYQINEDTTENAIQRLSNKRNLMELFKALLTHKRVLFYSLTPLKDTCMECNIVYALFKVFNFTPCHNYYLYNVSLRDIPLLEKRKFYVACIKNINSHERHFREIAS